MRVAQHLTADPLGDLHRRLIIAIVGCEMASINKLIPSFPTFPPLSSFYSPSILWNFSPGDYAKIAEEDLKVNWTRMLEICMRARNFEFELMFVQLN